MLHLTETMTMAIGEIGIIMKIEIIEEITMTMKVITVANMATMTGIIEQFQNLDMLKLGAASGWQRCD